MTVSIQQPPKTGRDCKTLSTPARRPPPAARPDGHAARKNWKPMRKFLLLMVLLLLFSARAASALEESSLHLLSRAWPDPPPAKVSEIGRGIGVVFSPDLSVPGNCRFYQALGFACF